MDGISNLVDQQKEHFAFKERRLKLLNGKRGIIEIETHQIACKIRKMEELIRSSKNKDNITDDVNRSEMDEEAIIQPDEVYPLKKNDDFIIYVVDDVKKIVDLSGDNIAPDMDPPANADVQVTLVEQLTTQLKVDNPPTTKQLEKPKSPPVIQAIQKEPTESVVTQPFEKEMKNTEKEIVKVISSEPAKKKQLDEDYDDYLSISGPIDMNNLSESEMMKIASVMQYRVHKKRLKEQRVEAETIQTVVDFLSSLLLETSMAHLCTPISKIRQLVANAFDKIKSLEDVAQLYAKKSQKKKYGEKQANDIDSGKMALSHNKSLLSEVI